MNALTPLAPDQLKQLSRFAEAESPWRIALEAELGARSFTAFFRMAWAQIDSSHLLWNWHIDLLCEEMEAIARRKRRNAVFAVPPRTGKSQLLSVAFPAWVWTWFPAAKFISASSEMGLAIRDAVNMRRLIKSPWYQRRWGAGSPYVLKTKLSTGKPHPGVEIVNDQDNKGYFENTARGHRFCCTPGSNVTGYGADFILCLHADTKLATERGLMRVADIVEGQAANLVLAYNHDTKAAEYRAITAYETHPGRAMVEIETEAGQVLRCTEDHPVWVEGRGYVPAGEIQPGEVVLTCPDAFIA